MINMFTSLNIEKIIILGKTMEIWKKSTRILFSEAKNIKLPCSKCGNQIICINQENKNQMVFLSATGKTFYLKEKCGRMFATKNISIT